MTATPSQAVIDRAFAIADESMFSQLECHCFPQDEYGVCLAMMDGAGRTVPSLAAAEEPIREAFEWLSMRGYVELCEDACGQFIWVLKRPEDEVSEVRP